MITVNRSELDQAIAGLEGAYDGTAKVLDQYMSEKEDLEKRGTDLDNRLNDLLQLKTDTLLKRDETKDTADYIKLSKQLTEADEEVQIIESLQEQLKEDLKQLKQKYIPVIRDSYSKDSAVKRDFDTNHAVDLVRYELLKAIADYAVAIRQEDARVIGTIRDEFLDDSILMQEQSNRGFQRTFDSDRNKLSYSSMMPNLLTKNNVFLACGGNISPEIRSPKPKEVK